MKRNHLKGVIASVVLLCSALVLAVGAVSSESPTVIRVGYALNYGTIKSPMVVGAEGYGYEYLNHIFEYIDGDYTLEFVYCEWTDAEQMLQDGEIDLMGPITSTEENRQRLLFSQMSFGDNGIFLSTTSEGATSYRGVLDIDGSTIAVQEGNPNEYLLTAFLEENQLEAEIAYFSENDYEMVMEHFGYDFCLTSSLQTVTSLTPLVTLGCVDSYYVTNTESQWIIDLIDTAMEGIYQSEFLYQERLYLNYYDQTMLASTYISLEEYALLQEQEMYYVGVDNIYGPICYMNDSGEFQGIAVDVMEMLAREAGIQYTLVDTSQGDSAIFETLDFAFLSYLYNWEGETVSSDIYCEMPFILVSNYSIADNEIDTIGILPHYGITADGDTGLLLQRSVHEYSSIVELVEAYNSGEVESIVLTTSTLNLMRGEFDDPQYISNTLDINLNLVMTFPADYPQEKVDIFNKLIAQIDSGELEASVLANSTQQVTQPTLVEYLESYPLVVLVVVLFLACTGLIFELRRRRLLTRMMNYDRLTGLYSTHKFSEEAQKILAGNSTDDYAVISVDIDNFKYINELFGYEKGNELLREIAQNLQRYATNGVVLARAEADTFLVLAKHQRDEHDSFEGRVRELSQFYLQIANTYNITFSVGIYEVIDHSVDVNQMVDYANIAREKGKGEAVTTIHVYDREMDSNRILTNDIVSHMFEALTNREFILYYQPKVNLKTGEIVGAEALVRWKKNGKIVMPNRFIPIFEKNGFIEQLDMYGFEQVCTFLAGHPSVPSISVNLSGVTIAKEDVVERLLELVERHQLSCSRIELELTETAFAGNMDEMTARLNTLRNHGFVISMDDFGAGISSLNRLKNLTIDVLKIDREFIIDCIDNHRGEQILKNIIAMAKDLELETVAEGVETQRQVTLLAQLGCDVGQGYYFSRPVTEREFLTIVERHK